MVPLNGIAPIPGGHGPVPAVSFTTLNHSERKLTLEGFLVLRSCGEAEKVEVTLPGNFFAFSLTRYLKNKYYFPYKNIGTYEDFFENYK